MPFLHAVLNIQQELSIVFHQDWRQLLAHARGAVGERNVVYFYSNGSATANRGAEVSECGTVRDACGLPFQHVPGHPPDAPRSS